MKQKAFSIIFKGFSVAKNCLRIESAPLSVYRNVFFTLLDDVEFDLTNLKLHFKLGQPGLIY